ncbi:MAG: hypothetical protein J0G32_05305 [Alphaproteobacteria bacterium]|nr:hypothetical protein [Alphaproteobacteria bacterium]OJV16008.1 MAG: hypothetical protein BGO27_04080 [Alphaproteobacteria bacterium 33-17]
MNSLDYINSKVLRKISDISVTFTYKDHFKEASKKIWNEAFQKQTVTVNFHDEGEKFGFVGLQAAFELAVIDLYKDGMATNIKYSIHTPLPPTPLISEFYEKYDDIFQKGIADERIDMSYLRKITVKNMLDSKINVYSLYSKECTDKKDNFENSLKVFDKYCDTYKNLNAMYTNDHMDSQFSGATCSFDIGNETYIFDLHAYQTTARDQGDLWEVSFGTIHDDHIINGRFGNVVESYLKQTFNFHHLEDMHILPYPYPI